MHRALIGMNGRVCACMGRAVDMSGSAGRCVGRVSVWTECISGAGESPDLGVRAAREDVWAVSMCVYRVCIRGTVFVHAPCRVCVARLDTWVGDVCGAMRVRAMCVRSERGVHCVLVCVHVCVYVCVCVCVCVCGGGG